MNSWPHPFRFSCQNFHALHDFVKEIVDFLLKKHPNTQTELSSFNHFMANENGTTPNPFVKLMSFAYLLMSIENTHKRQWQPFSHNWFCVDHQFRALWLSASSSSPSFLRGDLRANLFAADVDEPTRKFYNGTLFYRPCVCVRARVWFGLLRFIGFSAYTMHRRTKYKW